MTRITPLAAALALSLSLFGCSTSSNADAMSANGSDQVTADTATEAMPGTAPASALDDAVSGTWRSPANVARDTYRHPSETLSFFGLEPTDTVIEITPGGGWYTEILAPYVAKGGQYVAALPDPMAAEAGKARDGRQKAMTSLDAMFKSDAGAYGAAKVVGFDPKSPSFGAPGSADAVLTFRNVHNWRMSGQAAGMFKGFFAVLKPGGTLGVVEHRAKQDVADDDKSGYVGQAQLIAMAEAAGFKLEGKSEVNANPADTKDHPFGVWTLPPVRRSSPRGQPDDAKFDHAKYDAIGESDRMTLRFVKPVAAKA